MAASSPLDARRLTALVAALAVGIFFWDSPALWPLKLLVVMMHESGHALGALLVGGSVDHVVLAANEAGACLSRVPDGFFERGGRLLGRLAWGAPVAGAARCCWRGLPGFRLRRAVLGSASTCAWLGGVGLAVDPVLARHPRRRRVERGAPEPPYFRGRIR